MGKITDFLKDGLASSKDDQYTEVPDRYFDEPVQLRQDMMNLGWTLFPRPIGRILFEEMRGGDNRDYAVFIEIANDGGRILDYIDVGGQEDQTTAGNKMVDLKDAVVENAPKEKLNPADIRVYRNLKDVSAVYIQGSDSIMAVGYHDTSGSPKGVMMCALMLYVFAQINYDRDQTLFLNTFNYLPFRPDIGLDFSFYRLADDLIEEVLNGQEGGEDAEEASQEATE